MTIALPFFLARPAGTGPWPGIVVCPEGNGMSPQLLRVCQRLAGEGYAALAPDVFWRLGGSDPDRPLESLRSISTDDLVADANAAVAELRRLGCERVGITGFCMGGRTAYLAAAEGVPVDACAPFYGAGIGRLLTDLGCPLLAFYGGRDEWIPTEEIEAVQARHGADVVVYPEAGHGFFREGSPSYDDAAATDAWQRLLPFLDRSLR